jgi:hypothetical protein
VIGFLRRRGEEAVPEPPAEDDGRTAQERDQQRRLDELRSRSARQSAPTLAEAHRALGPPLQILQRDAGTPPEFLVRVERLVQSLRSDVTDSGPLNWLVGEAYLAGMLAGIEQERKR